MSVLLAQVFFSLWYSSIANGWGGSVRMGSNLYSSEGGHLFNKRTTRISSQSKVKKRKTHFGDLFFFFLPLFCETNWFGIFPFLLILIRPTVKCDQWSVSRDVHCPSLNSLYVYRQSSYRSMMVPGVERLRSRLVSSSEHSPLASTHSLTYSIIEYSRRRSPPAPYSLYWHIPEAVQTPQTHWPVTGYLKKKEKKL